MSDDPLLRILRELRADPLLPVSDDVLRAVAAGHRTARRRRALTAAAAGVAVVAVLGVGLGVALSRPGTTTRSTLTQTAETPSPIVLGDLRVDYLPAGLVLIPGSAGPSREIKMVAFRAGTPSPGLGADVAISVTATSASLDSVRRQGILGYTLSAISVGSTAGLLGVDASGRAVVVVIPAPAELVRVDARSPAEAERIAQSIHVIGGSTAHP